MTENRTSDDTDKSEEFFAVWGLGFVIMMMVLFIGYSLYIIADFAIQHPSVFGIYVLGVLALVFVPYIVGRIVEWVWD